MGHKNKQILWATKISRFSAALTLTVLSLFHKIGHICRTKSCKWVNTQWRALYALPVDSYGHTALKGLNVR